MERDHEGKKYAVIMGKLNGEDTMTLQAYRYPKATWTADAARAHAKAHDCTRFEAATGEEKECQPCTDEKALRKAYGTTEGPLGLPMKDEAAHAVEELLKAIPSDCRELLTDGPLRRVKVAEDMQLIEGERTDVSIITTDAVDHDREVIEPRGVNMDHFRKTGMPVTWAHRYDLMPVGNAVWVEYKRGRKAILAKTRYHDRPEGWQGNWFSDAIWHLIKTGVLRGKSIGFIPQQIHAPSPDEIKERPELADARVIYDKITMLEYAVAPIPANPDALVQAAAKAKSAGLIVPEMVFADCGIIIPDALGDIDWEGLDHADSTTNRTTEVGADETSPPLLTRTQIIEAFERKTTELLVRMPTLLDEVIARKRGRV